LLATNGIRYRVRGNIKRNIEHQKDEHRTLKRRTSNIERRSGKDEETEELLKILVTSIKAIEKE